MQFSKLFSFISAALLVSVVFMGLVSVSVVAQSESMQYRCDAGHNGDYSPFAGSAVPNNELKWQVKSYDLDTVRDGAFGPPSVVDGVLYIGGYRLYAFDVTTGAEKWNYTIDQDRSPLFSAPAVADQTVYVRTGRESGNALSAPARLCAVDAISGIEKWNFTPSPQSSGYVSIPTVAGDTVYTELNGILYAINTSTGQPKWSKSYNNILWPDAPAVANGLVYVPGGGTSSKFYALDAATGTEVWNVTSSGTTAFGVANNVVYLGDRNFSALDLTTGQVIWNFTPGGSSYVKSFAVSKGEVYVSTWGWTSPFPVPPNTNVLDNVTAFTAITGTKLWNVTLGSRVSTLVSANGYVYGGGFDQSNGENRLYAIDTATRKNIWNYTEWGDLYAPAVVEGTVYASWNLAGGPHTIKAIGTQPEPTPTHTTLTATVSASVVAINKQFSISGTLNTTDGTPLIGTTIQLQKNMSGKWTDVAGKTNTTTSTGAYRISTSEPKVRTYQYRTTYAGDDIYAGTNSTSVSVKVVSRASVLADISALRSTVTRIPASAFTPGTKIAALAVINAADINVRVGSYGGATTTLKTSLLARTDGCVKNGKPDSNDWVRTCAAQGQLYPQVLNLIQELKALQGS